MCRLVVQVEFNNTLHQEFGAPATALLSYAVNPDEKRIDVNLTWQNKTSTMMPEATTVFHRPSLKPGYRWSYDSLGEWVGFSNVTQGGERYMHAAWTGIRYGAADPHAASTAASLQLRTWDAGMVCPVLNDRWDPSLTPEIALERNCFEYGKLRQAELHPVNDSMIGGMGINLHNNRMGISGFAEWYPFGVGSRYQKQDETAQFRFAIEEIN